eukprot:PRCOL_00005055-RA
MTDAFRDALGVATPRYAARAFIREYLREQRAWPPEGICLVGTYADARTGELALAATATLSFTPGTREDFAELAPPPHGAYLCNMATLPELRRRGVARAMLGACVDFCAHMGDDEIWLHARVGDAPSVGLYEACGFEARGMEADEPLLKRLMHGGVSQRRMLMRRPPSSGKGEAAVEDVVAWAEAPPTHPPRIN